MSFLKITDTAKRDFLVDEFFKTKRNIQNSFISEKLGDFNLQQDLAKLYKPITDSQAGLSNEIKQSAQATTTALKALPSQLKAITLPQYPSIEAFQEPDELNRTLEFGNIASKYLFEYAANRKAVDKTFGIRSEHGQFYIGTSPITIHDNDITVGDNTYFGTPGLWELLTMSDPDESIYTDSDLRDYGDILDETNAMRMPSNPNRPKSNRSEKYRNIIKPIWDAKVTSKTGKGVSQTIILPSDPNALIEMLALRMASYKAGNTGAANEAVAICDELLRQRVVDREKYKAIMTQLS